MASVAFTGEQAAGPSLGASAGPEASQLTCIHCDTPGAAQPCSAPAPSILATHLQCLLSHDAKRAHMICGAAATGARYECEAARAVLRAGCAANSDGGHGQRM